MRVISKDFRLFTEWLKNEDNCNFYIIVSLRGSFSFDLKEMKGNENENFKKVNKFQKFECFKKMKWKEELMPLLITSRIHTTSLIYLY